MIKINLVPRDILDQEVQKQRTLQAAVVVALVLVMVAGASFLRWNKARKLEAKQAEMQKEYDRLKAIAAEADALEAKVKQVQARLKIIDGLLQGRPLYPLFMVDFARTLPPQVWVKTLGTSAGKGRGELAVSASAGSTTSEAIADWIRNLEQSGRFKDPVLSAISASGVEPAKVHSFSVTVSYKNPDL